MVDHAELKANWSRYFGEVRRGGEVEVLDPGAPVARLVPSAPGGEQGLRERLIGEGLSRPGAGNASAVLELPPLALPVSLSESMAEDRSDRFEVLGRIGARAADHRRARQ